VVVIYVALAIVFGAVICVQMVIHSKAQEAWADERSKLLDRIQKPEMVGLPEVEIRKQYAGIDDDEETWEATNEMNALNG
jgi:hypothetical protein